MPSYSRKAEFKKAVLDKCSQIIKDCQQAPEIDDMPGLVAFRAEFRDAVIQPLARDVFGEFIPLSLANSLTEASYEFYCRQIASEYHTGVVIAGIGESELFPALYEYVVDGKDGLALRSWLLREHDTNNTKSRKTLIIPFGQDDIFHLFMEGISPVYIEFLQLLLRKVLNDKSDELVNSYVATAPEKVVERARQRKDNKLIVESFEDEFGRFRQAMVVQPIVNVVRALPKDEMAEMARALVELTSLRRKVDASIESVGGPVDVAIISKSDGLIWMERKHYFDFAKNPDFLQRRSVLKGSNR